MTTMTTGVAQSIALDALWDEFLARWPLESLHSMSLADYTQAGSKDCFTYWLESRTEDLGSIWGGSAFKFGVYSRKDQTEKTASSIAKAFSTTHGWLTKYGASANEAFERVRAIVASVAQAARAGDLDAVEAADLGSTTKWKIAFLYQERQHPCVLPVFLLAALQAQPGTAPKSSCAELHRVLMSAKPEDEPLLAYGQRLWSTAEQMLQASLSNDEVLAYLQGYPGLTPIKPPTEKHAGFRCLDGRELCLLRSRKTPVLYVQPGDWRDSVATNATNYKLRGPDDTRSHGLAANAPSLAAPNEAAALTVGTWEFLLEFLEAYTGTAAPAARTIQGASMLAVGDLGDHRVSTAGRHEPLNQILYGPPGTGKTYSTIDAALAVLDAAHLAQYRNDRSTLKARFDALVREHRIRFVTFHQSFSYEDFVEGLRATTNEDTGQIRYEVVDGVFKCLCEAAAVKVTRPQEVATPAAPLDIRGRRIWKMSLGNTLGSDAAIYDECIEKGCALLGYGDAVDFAGCTSRADVLQRFTANSLPVENPQTDYAVTSVAAFVTRMKPGDLLVISDGNFKFRAIGEVSGEYKVQPHSNYPDSYAQMRPVKWLRVYEPSLPHGELMNSQFSQMTLYELRAPSIDLSKLEALLNSAVRPFPPSGGLVPGPVRDSSYEIVRVNADIVELRKPQGRSLSLGMSLIWELVQAVRAGRITVADIREKRVTEKLPGASADPYLVNGYSNVLAPLVAQLIGIQDPADSRGAEAALPDARVLIIDEINRGNISRIFGELITLIEPSKRAGAEEALEVVLPYSKKPFSVPQNVYLIGTMNTADRSLTGMDVALRRRFVFRAMPPRDELLKGVEVEGIPVDRLLSVINQRIEALLDRDHCLGHAYFMPLRRAPTLTKLAEIFGNQVLPLLQEYFFDDWQRIQWVLNDHRKPEAFQFVSATGVDVDELFGGNVNVAHGPKAWAVNDEAFLLAESYLGVIDYREAQDDE
jgi:5-methylcytosine-specific restriction protein B